MSVNATFGLLSSTGMQSLQAFSNNSAYVTALGTVSGYNSATGKNHGFNTQSIFTTSAGTDAFSSFELTGMLPGKSSSTYSGGGFGSSLVGNYLTSLNNVGLGQGAASTIFEQRLAYSMGLSEVPRAYYPDGNYSDEFSLSTTTTSDSDSSSKSGASAYDVFSTAKSGSSTLSLLS